MSLRLVALSLACMALLPMTLEAAMTGSGADASDAVTEEHQQAWRTQALRFKQQLLQDKKNKTSEAHREALQRYRKQTADHHRRCRMDIRSANRDTKLKTVLRCLRGALVLEQEFREVEQDALYAIPGATEAHRLKAVKASDDLLEAIATVIDGIDGRVFGSIEELVETKQKLNDQYRVPLARAFVLLRADRAVSWIARLGSLTLDAAEEEATVKSSAIHEEWREVLTCLASTEDELNALLSSKEDEETAGSLRKIQENLRGCAADLRTVLEHARGRIEEEERLQEEDAARRAEEERKQEILQRRKRH